MEKVIERITKVKTMIHGNGAEDSMSKARSIFDRVKAEVAEIAQDRTLSPIGVAEKERYVKEKGAVDLAKLVRSFRQAVDKELDVAEREARAIIAKPVIKPAQHVIDEFTEKYQDALTKLTVFGGANNARHMFDILRETDDPYFAKILRDDFGKYGTQLRSHIDAIQLQTAYDRSCRVADTDVKISARKALEEVEKLRETSPVNGMITLGVDSALGSEHRGAITQHQSFLSARGL